MEFWGGLALAFIKLANLVVGILDTEKKLQAGKALQNATNLQATLDLVKQADAAADAERARIESEGLRVDDPFIGNGGRKL